MTAETVAAQRRLDRASLRVHDAATGRTYAEALILEAEALERLAEELETGARS